MMASESETLRLNPQLDLDGAGRAFRERGRVRIDDVLEPDSAERLHTCLSSEVRWRLCYNEGTENVVVDAESFAKQTPEARRGLMQRILSNAETKFQYVFQSYPMVAAYLRGEDPGLFLHRVLEWLNTPETLDVFRAVTGVDTLHKIDAQATLYKPGNFLKVHDDTSAHDEGRRVAYVLGMTRGWRPDWGGQLQFLDADGDVEEAWVPRFNSLALFAVPTPHVVTYVAPFAQLPRYAVTGWACDA